MPKVNKTKLGLYPPFAYKKNLFNKLLKHKAV